MSEIVFLIDTNLGLPVEETPWPAFMAAHDIRTLSTTDLVRLDQMVVAHEPDVAFLPIADFHRLVARGDSHYRGLAIATSKFTGTTNLPSVLVVRKDDPANALLDLEGAKYGYINKSCSSSYFAPAILLQRHGRSLGGFFELVPTAPWQGQIDAVVANRVRATMVPEDIWQTSSANASTTRIVDRYDNATPAVVVVRHDLDEALCRALLDALVTWVPRWEAVYGAFRPFYRADVHRFFHDLELLSPDM